MPADTAVRYDFRPVTEADLPMIADWLAEAFFAMDPSGKPGGFDDKAHNSAPTRIEDEDVDAGQPREILGRDEAALAMAAFRPGVGEIDVETFDGIIG